MARKTTQESFSELVKAARDVCPEIAITTDLIAGFPGETDAEFTETMAYVKAMGFSGGHVFTYSPRQGTAAAKMPGQVPTPVRKARNAELREVIGKTSSSYRSRFLGKSLPVLWESAASLGPNGWEMSGLTDNNLRVHALAPQDLWNLITRVKLTGLKDTAVEGDLVGL
jgi:threonylcarbamoyladenosine tRNA methylthiotransferase MtaB